MYLLGKGKLYDHDTRNCRPPVARAASLLSGFFRGFSVSLFLAAGSAKTGRLPLQWSMFFDKVGVGQWFRYFTGLLEVVAGIGFGDSPVRLLCGCPA